MREPSVEEKARQILAEAANEIRALVVANPTDTAERMALFDAMDTMNDLRLKFERDLKDISTQLAEIASMWD